MKKRFMRAGLVTLVLACSIGMSTVAAKDTLLAQTEVLYENNKAQAELWGDQLDSGYAGKLLLILKREDGSIITGYKPTVKGGYGCTLQALQVKDKKATTEQLLLAVRQGDWRVYSEYRLLDISDVKAIKELFNGVDSFGIVLGAKLEGNTLQIQTVKDKEPLSVELNADMVEDISANRKQVSYGNLQSLTALDVNNDGVKELLTDQQIIVDKRILADVGAVWRYAGPQDEKLAKTETTDTTTSSMQAKQTVKSPKAEQVAEQTVEKALTTIQAIWKDINDAVGENDATKDKTSDKGTVQEASSLKLWKQDHLTIMKADVPNRKNTINCGAFFVGGMVYPVKMIAPNGEATYPQIMLKENVKLENAWNKLLLKESDSYIKKFLRGQADLAYNVVRADQKLVTIQLISGKNSFVHHLINLVPGEEKPLQLTELFNMHKARDLAELLNVLNTNPKLTWDAKLTEEWYLRDNSLYLMKNVDGVDEVSSFELKNLQGYLKDKRFSVSEAGGKADAKTNAEDKTKDKTKADAKAKVTSVQNLH